MAKKPEETQQKPSHNPAETQTEPKGNRVKQTKQMLLEKNRVKQTKLLIINVNVNGNVNNIPPKSPTGDKGLFGHLIFRIWLRACTENPILDCQAGHNNKTRSSGRKE